MPINYAALVSTVQTLLAPYPKGNGTVMTCTRKISGEFDATTGEMTDVAPVVVEFVGIQIPVDSSYIDGNQNGWRKQYANGTDIVEVDAKIIIAPNANNDKPDLGDTFDTPDGQFTVKTAEPLSPTGIILLWEIGLVR